MKIKGDKNVEKNDVESTEMAKIESVKESKMLEKLKWGAAKVYAAYKLVRFMVLLWDLFEALHWFV